MCRWISKVYLDSMSRDVHHSCTHCLRPRNSPLPPHLDSYYEGAMAYWSAKIDDISL
jgi:hypothetical protein